MSKKKTTLSSILAFFSGTLGTIGVSGWCCTITGAAVMSFLGLASISSFLTYNSKWLFVLSIVFTSMAIYYYINYKNNKNCTTKKYAKKN